MDAQPPAVPPGELIEPQPLPVPAAPAAGSEGAQALDDDERRHMAHILRLGGVPYPEIATRLGYSTTHAAERAAARAAVSHAAKATEHWNRAVAILEAQGYSFAQLAAAVRERELREARAVDPGPRPKASRRSKRMKAGELPPLPTLPLPPLPTLPSLPAMPTDSPAAPRAEIAE